MAPIAAEKSLKREDSVACGAVYLVGAQFALLVAGYVIHAFLGRTLLPSAYGLFGVVMAFLVWMEVSLTGGFPYAIRKFGAEDPANLPAVARTAIKGQLIYAAALLVLAQVSAPWIAAVLREPQLAWLIRLAALDIPIFALYFPYLGILNGRRAFMKQGVSMALYAGAKVIGVLALVLLGWGVVGALIGNILASVIGFGAAAAFSGRLGPGRAEPMNKVISYAAGTAGFGIIFTLLISIDIFCVKALISGGDQVGYYVAASTLAKAPFLLFLGIAGATLPAVSKAVSTHNSELARTYVSQALRLHVLMLLPITLVISGSSGQLVGLVYGSGYTSAGPALGLLMIGLMLFGLLNTLTNMLLAAGETRAPLIAMSLLVAAELGLSIWLIPEYGLLGGAAAATLTAAGGLVVAISWIFHRFGPPLQLMSLLRIVAASAVIYLLTRVIYLGAPWLLAVYGGLAALYVLLLIAMGELTRADLGRLRSVFVGSRGNREEGTGAGISDLSGGS